LVDTAERTEDEADRPAERARSASSSLRLSSATFVGGIVLTVVLFAIGAWQRRWIADDGLIVLRTVRNLLAGNGPVFNMDERVETNTSAAWTYIVWFFSWLTQMRLEYVVLAVALTLSLIAMVFAMLGAARLWGGPRTALLLPAGVLVYIAVPPARDYATSGLESGLVICWLAVLWWSLMRWARAERVRPGALAGLVFLAGLAPLIRPEMTLVGGLALVMIFFAPMPQWRLGPVATRALIVAVAGLVPLGYQIWRMGYYGLPYPNTAVAKDAGGAKWSQGFTYLWDLVGPYLLWLPLLILLAAAIVAVRGGGLPAWSPAGDGSEAPGGAGAGLRGAEHGRHELPAHAPGGAVHRPARRARPGGAGDRHPGRRPRRRPADAVAGGVSVALRHLARARPHRPVVSRGGDLSGAGRLPRRAHARRPQAPARFVRVCGEWGRRAVALARPGDRRRAAQRRPRLRVPRPARRPPAARVSARPGRRAGPPLSRTGAAAATPGRR